ncbi:MAG: hypothetical protein GX167_09500 [Firmicutes bacterium]|jgi:arginine repressor|nr:hypothetical protein [Bacillota bacterium]
MSNPEKDRQAFVELEQKNKDAAANETTADMTSQQSAPAWSQLAQKLQAVIKQQQLKTEQNIQQTLQQASIALSAAARIEQLLKQVALLQGPANNIQYYRQVLQQVNQTVHEQLHQADRQIAESLQQTVSGLTQAQAAIFDSQAYFAMAELVKQCELLLSSRASTDGQTVH